MRAYLISLFLFTFSLILSSQTMTRGKLTYVKTIEQLIEYHAFDTIISSDPLALISTKLNNHP